MGVLKFIKPNLLSVELVDGVYPSSESETASLLSWGESSAMSAADLSVRRVPRRGRWANKSRNVGGAWQGLQEARLSAGAGAGARGARAQRRHENDAYLRQLSSVDELAEADFTCVEPPRLSPLARLCQLEAGAHSLERFSEQSATEELEAAHEENEEELAANAEKAWSRVSPACRALLLRRPALWATLEQLEQQLRAWFGPPRSALDWQQSEDTEAAASDGPLTDGGGSDQERMLIHAVAHYLGLLSQSRTSSAGVRLAWVRRRCSRAARGQHVSGSGLGFQPPNALLAQHLAQLQPACSAAA